MARTVTTRSTTAPRRSTRTTVKSPVTETRNTGHKAAKPTAAKSSRLRKGKVKDVPVKSTKTRATATKSKRSAAAKSQSPVTKSTKTKTNTKSSESVKPQSTRSPKSTASKAAPAKNTSTKIKVQHYSAAAAPRVSYAAMVANAVGTLKDPQGASYMAITKFIGGYYLKDVNKDSVKLMIRRGLKRATENGALTKASGQGAWVRFKLTAKGSKDPPKATTTGNTASKKTSSKRGITANAIKTDSTSPQPAATTSTSSQTSQKSTQVAPAEPAGSSQAAPKSDASSQAPSEATGSSQAPSKTAGPSLAPSKSAGASQPSSTKPYTTRVAKAYSQPVASSTVTAQSATQVVTAASSHVATSLTQNADASNNSVASVIPADSVCTVVTVAQVSLSAHTALMA